MCHWLTWLLRAQVLTATSAIFSTVPDVCRQEFARLFAHTWLPGKSLGDRLYASATDGFSYDGFMSKCACVAPMIVVVRSINGYVFGGYTSTPWREGANQACADAFLFAVTNPHTGGVACFPLKTPAATCVVGSFRRGNPELYFGGGADLTVFYSGGQCYSNLGHTFADVLGKGWPPSQAGGSTG